MSYNKDLDDGDPSWLEPGEWCFDGDGTLIAKLPCGDLFRSNCRDDPPGWTVSGPREAPTNDRRRAPPFRAGDIRRTAAAVK